LIQQYIFHFLAFLITVCSLLVVTSHHPVKSAIFLVFDLFLMAAMFALLEAHFVAIIQVLVYAGAITVLFVFVIMLLNLQAEEKSSFKLSIVEVGTLLLMLVGFVITMIKVYGGEPTGIGGSNLTVGAVEQAGGNTKLVALQLLGKYIWPFEIASILILLAIIASIVIAKKDKPQKIEGANGPG